MRVPSLVAVGTQPAHDEDWMWSYTHTAFVYFFPVLFFDNFTHVYNALCSSLLLTPLLFLLTLLFPNTSPSYFHVVYVYVCRSYPATAAVCLQLQ